MSSAKATSPNLERNEISKIRERRQGSEHEVSFIEGLVPTFHDASDTIRVFVISGLFIFDDNTMG